MECRLIAKPATIRKAIAAIDAFGHDLRRRQHATNAVTLQDIEEINARCRRVLLQVLAESDMRIRDVARSKRKTKLFIRSIEHKPKRKCNDE